MAKILEFKPKAVEDEPHTSGGVICYNCKHTWTAIAPVGRTNLECPNCGAHKGLHDSPVRWPGDRFTCWCGCYLFVRTIDLDHCYHCGKILEEHS